MWKLFVEFAKRVASVAQTTQRNTASIAYLHERLGHLSEELRTLQEEQRDIIEAIRHLATKIERVQETEFHEREKLMLRLEIALLRAERSLPPEGGEPASKDG